MPESLAQLEGQRADLLAQFPDLGDFRHAFREPDRRA